MIIETKEGIRIKCLEEPHWNDFHKAWYVWGYRWIKTKKQFSGVNTLHNFKEFTKEQGE